MTTPLEKSPEMARLLDEMSSSIFGRTRTEALELGLCVVCSGVAKDFRDALSAKEYLISGMCQDDQDKVFN